MIESEQWQGNITPARFGAMALGYIDNDEYRDIISTGCLSDGGNDCENGVITKIYINNGTTFLENQTWGWNLTSVGLSSVAFGDIDNDGNLDLALTGCDSSTSFNCNGNRFAKIYINNGTSLIENSTWQQNLTAVTEGSITFGDIDNDGDLDLSQIGSRTTSPYLIGKIYINNGTSLVESVQWQNELEGIQRGNIAFGDIDNDGDLDLILSGYEEGVTEVTKIYINNGTSLIESPQWQQGLTQMGESSVLLGDYDNDGDMDLIMNGHTTGDRFHIYNNNGTTLILNQTDTVSGGVLLGLYSSSIAFGDYDNDGDMDLIGMGWEYGRTRIYENNNSIFQNDPTAHLNISDDLYMGSLSWSDFDNDNNLDVILVGYEYAQGLKAKIYINNITNNNALPNPPTSSFSSTYSNNILTLSWGNGSDTETNTSGLYYNLKVGILTNNNSIVSGVYGGKSGSNEGGGGGANGYFGNMMQRKSINLNLPTLQQNQTIYWSVQTIDTGLAKSNWSAEQNYTIPMDSDTPTITINSPSSNYNTSNTTITFNITVFDDENVTNISLYSSWGGWNLNETNTSPVNNSEWILTRNLSNYGDATYYFYYRSCDNSSNCINSSTQAFRIDTTSPAISLISPANSSTYTSGNTITFSYNVTDDSVSNCSLFVDDALTEEDTSITVNTTQTISRTLSNGNYNWSIYCTDLVDLTNSTGTYLLTVSYTPPASTPSSGTTGSSTTGGGTTSSTVKKSWDTIEPGTDAELEIDHDEIPLTKITIQTNTQVNSAKITIEYIENKTEDITEPAETTYKYLNITETNINETVLKKAVIRFKVSKNWITENYIDENKVYLMRYTNRQWNKLPTKMVSVNLSASPITGNIISKNPLIDLFRYIINSIFGFSVLAEEEYLYYEAETPGFSLFAISGEKKTEFVCNEADKMCTDNRLYQCINNSWSVLENCSQGCDNVTRSCIVPETIEETICTENETVCDGDLLKNCVDSNWTVVEECEFGCVEGECKGKGEEATDYFWVWVIGIIVIITILIMFIVKRVKSI